MTHTVTAADFTTTKGDDLYYTGPLAEAKAFIMQDHGVREHVLPNGLVEVLIGYDSAPPADMADTAEWGRGGGSEDAWRWALAAAFGPLDDEFHSFPLTITEQS